VDEMFDFLMPLFTAGSLAFLVSVVLLLVTMKLGKRSVQTHDDAKECPEQCEPRQDSG